MVYPGLSCTLLSTGRGSLVGVVLYWRLGWPLSSVDILSWWRLSSCLLRALPGPVIEVSAGETATWRYWGACFHRCTSRSILTRRKGALMGSLLWGALLSLGVGAWALIVGALTRVVLSSVETGLIVLLWAGETRTTVAAGRSRVKLSLLLCHLTTLVLRHESSVHEMLEVGETVTPGFRGKTEC